MNPFPDLMLPALLTLEEVAAAGRLSPKTIRNAVYARDKDGGRGRGIGRHVVRVSGRLRWPREIVEVWLRGQLPDQAVHPDPQSRRTAPSKSTP